MPNWSVRNKMRQNEINVVGIIQPDVGSGHLHFQDRIYDSKGIARSVCQRDYKDSMRVLIYKKERNDEE